MATPFPITVWEPPASTVAETAEAYTSWTPVEETSVAWATPV